MIQIFITFVIGDNVKDMSDEDKQSFGRAIDKIEQLPSIGKEGAAPTSDLLKDYLVAGVYLPIYYLLLLVHLHLVLVVLLFRQVKQQKLVLKIY